MYPDGPHVRNAAGRKMSQLALSCRICIFVRLCPARFVYYTPPLYSFSPTIFPPTHAHLLLPNIVSAYYTNFLQVFRIVMKRLFINVKRAFMQLLFTFIAMWTGDQTLENSLFSLRIVFISSLTLD